MQYKKIAMKRPIFSIKIIEQNLESRVTNLRIEANTKRHGLFAAPLGTFRPCCPPHHRSRIQCPWKAAQSFGCSNSPARSSRLGWLCLCMELSLLSNRLSHFSQLDRCSHANAFHLFVHKKKLTKCVSPISMR